MKRNMSDLDRIIRVVIVALFGYLYFGGVVTGALGIVLLVLSVIFLFTSVTSFCPVYSLFKLGTYKK
jgi:hypothetical protein